MNATINVLKLLARLVETKAETVTLGMDVHARDVVVCVQLDGARPQRPQKLTAARKLAVDLWRLATNQTTPAQLQLSVRAAA